jgi:hypothetical protein
MKCEQKTNKNSSYTIYKQKLLKKQKKQNIVNFLLTYI